MKKKAISLFAALALLSTSSMATLSLTAQAAGDPTIIVESVEAKPGDDVAVQVSVENNPGVWGMDVVISYDKTDLTLTNVENGGFFQAGEWTPGKLDGETYTLSYEASGFENITTTSGVLAILNFKVSENASSSEYSITASYNAGSCINIAFEEINFGIVNGTITLPTPETVHTHNLTKIEAKASTCQKKGNNEYYYCEGCGKYFKDAEAKTETTVEAEKLPLGNHNYVENPSADNLKSEATCTKQAVYYKSCSACGAKSDETFTYGELKDHDYSDEWKYDVNGHWHECKNCGDKHDEAAHISSGAATETKDEVCTVCGYVIAPKKEHTHNLTLVEGKEATCTAEGQKAYYKCDGCDKWFEDGTASIEITDKSSIVIPKKEHTASDWIVDKAATETEKGSKHKECVNCHTVLATEEIPIPPKPSTQPSIPVATQSSTPVATQSSTPVVTQPSTPVVTQPSTPVATQSSTPSVTQKSTGTGSTISEPTNKTTNNTTGNGAVQTGAPSFAALILVVMILGLAIPYITSVRKKNK